MLFIALVVLIATVVYLYRLLTTSSGSEFEDNSIDAFISQDDNGTRNDVGITSLQKDKYKQDYTAEGRQVLILYGTEYGCCEEISKLLYDRIKEVNSGNTIIPLQPRLINAKHHHIIDFSREQICFVVISTSGDGVPPTEAREFVDSLLTTDRKLHGLRYSVLALGDSNYPQFCKTGRIVNKRLCEMNAQCIVDYQDVDMEDWTVINKWLDRVIEYLKEADLTVAMDYIQHGDITEDLYSRNRPFMATLKTKYTLTVCDTPDDKETIHCEFDISGSDLTWTSGDALGIYPKNNPREVKILLDAMHCSGKEMVEIPTWAYQKPNGNNNGTEQLSNVLLKYFDLKSIKKELLDNLKDNLKDVNELEKIDNILGKSNIHVDKSYQDYIKEREVADVLLDFKSHTLPFSCVLKCMKSLQPRYYSISSSAKLNSTIVCVTVAILRYKTLDKPRTGVATTFLQDRLNLQDECPVFISRNPDFRLPDDTKIPVIMIGPGTGIAPFMAFIQERAMVKDCGQTWLYFGCRHERKDYIYRPQLERWVSDNIIRLSIAFSRDQDRKVYVQDLIKADADRIWQLINAENASVYVCGDAKQMAHDVHNTLKHIVMQKGNIGEPEAADYLKRLEDSARYQKDVWVV